MRRAKRLASLVAVYWILMCMADTFTPLHYSNSSLRSSQTIVIIGGGFLGTEVALAMASRARAFNADRSPGQPRIKILQVYAEKSPLASYLPRYLSQDVKERLERHGV